MLRLLAGFNVSVERGTGSVWGRGIHTVSSTRPPSPQCPRLRPRLSARCVPVVNLSVHPGRRSPHRPIPSGRLQPGLRACPSRAHTRTQSLTQAHTRSNTHMCTHLQHGPTLTLHTFSCARTHTYVYLTCMYMCTSYTDTFHIHAQVPHTDHTPVHTHSSDINRPYTCAHKCGLQTCTHKQEHTRDRH